MSRAARRTAALIRSERQLAQWLEDGCVTPDKQDIGIEHEKFMFHTSDLSPVAYDPDSLAGKKGIRDFFAQAASRYSWKTETENDNTVALTRARAGWTLEPGGQMETSGSPHADLHRLAAEVDVITRESASVCAALGMDMAGLGFHPLRLHDAVPSMPVSRHKFLRQYLEHKKMPNTMDIWWCTATAQTSINFTSERDMVQKLRVSTSLQPVATALCANSPFREGRPSGYQSWRSHILHNAAGGRVGFMLPVAFEQGFGFERFVRFALEVPLLGVYKDQSFIDAHEGRFADLMDGTLAGFEGRRAALSDWCNHLNTIWPEVRLRRMLEQRGADSGPPDMVKALAAFWTGLLYDSQALDHAYEMVRNWTHEDRAYLRAMTPMQGLQTPFRNNTTTVQELAKETLALAEAGLKRRNLRNAAGEDESIYLKPMQEIADSGRTLAQQDVEKYRKVWKGDLSRLFAEHSIIAVAEKLPPPPAAPAKFRK